MLHRCPLFTDLSPEDTREALRFFQAQEKRYARGELLKNPVEPLTAFGLALEGYITVTMQDIDGREMLLAHVGPGQTFGESLCYLRENAPLTIAAQTDARVLWLRCDGLRQAAEGDLPATLWVSPSETNGIPSRIELNQNHMHSVPMQSFVDFGYAGLLAWLFWTMLGLRATARLARLARRPAPGSSLPETACFAAPLAMFAALVLYGLVEYHLADSEVVLLYALAMGLTGPSLLRAAPDASAGAAEAAPAARRRTWAWLLAYLALGAFLCGGFAVLCRAHLRILALG